MRVFWILLVGLLSGSVAGPLSGQVSSADGTAAIGRGVGFHPGVVTFNAAAKELSLDWRLYRSTGDRASLLGLTLKGKATNDLSSILSSGDVVTGSSLQLLFGHRLKTDDSNLNSTIQCVEDAILERMERERSQTEEAGSGAGGELQADTFRTPDGIQVVVERPGRSEVPRVEGHEHPSNTTNQAQVVDVRTACRFADASKDVGGVWLFGAVGWKGSTTPLLVSRAGSVDSVTTREFDSFAGRAGVAFWGGGDRWTVAGSASMGYERENNLSLLKQRVVRDVLRGGPIDTLGGVRSVEAKESVAYEGEYREYGTIPISGDLFVSTADIEALGLWLFLRARSRSELGTDDDLTIGIGPYLFANDNPFLPTGAIALEYGQLGSKRAFRLNLVAAFGLGPSILGGT